MQFNLALEEVPEGLRERGKRKRAEAILEAARELLREDPDQGLTIERLAARAEVSPPTIFNLIGRRDEIWSALLDQDLAQIDFLALRAIADGRERAHALIGALIDVMLDDAPVHRALLANWTHSGRMVRGVPHDVLEECFAGRTGVDPRRTAELVQSGMVGIAHQWSAHVLSDDEVRAYGRDLVDLAFTAAGPADPSTHGSTT